MRAAATVLSVAAVFAVSICVGPGRIAPEVVAQILLGADGSIPDVHRAIVWDLRLPRVLLAALLGGALAAAGAVTQGLFRNPMAAPGVLGISMGSAAFAVAGFSLGLDAAGIFVTPLLAGLGAVVSLVILMMLAGPLGNLTTLLLSGVALGALFSAFTTLMLAMDTENWDLGIKVIRWLMGSFEGRSWSHLLWSVPPVALGLVAAGLICVDLDVLHLGPDTATTLGVDPRRLRWLAICAVALLVGTATAMAGVIGFVGLIVPHITRLFVGGSHRRLVPYSAAVGAMGLLAVDTASRATTAVLLPPGVITSLLGAPFFLWLLRRHAGGFR